MVSILTLIVAVWSFGSTTAQRHQRPERPALDSLELEHLGGGIRFKLKRPNAFKKRIGGDIEHEDATAIGLIVKEVKQAIGHLTGGGEPQRVFRHAGIHEQKHIDAGLHLWYRLDMAETKTHEADAFAAQKRVLAAVKLLRGHSSFEALEHVDPEHRIKQHYLTNDPQLGDQRTEHYDMINLPSAWDLTTGSPSTVVQVIDSGIDMDHPDLQNNKWANPGEVCGNGVDDDGNGFEDDCQGYNHADNSGTVLDGDGSHGTHCAGTIAADSDNGVGVAGVAGGKNGNPGASLMISTVFGTTDTAGFEEALVYGADNGAHISSNSWGYTSAGVYDQSCLDAMDYAEANGVVVVFAAGNDGDDGNWYPGYYPACVAVAAGTKTKAAASFTNYGSWVDITAPGDPVLSTVIGGYDWYSGTSMACPHVAGGLALAKSYKPSATPAELKACLFSTAMEIDSLSSAKYAGGLGAGHMDVRAMLDCMGPSPTPAPTWTAKPSGQPVPAPTRTPISCGDCSHTLQLVLSTDSYPEESSYSLALALWNPCFTDVEGPSSTWSSNTDYTVTVSDKICDNMEYDWKFFDSYGDGICCSYGSGSYHLELDGKKIFESDGNFGSTETFFFTATPSTPVPAPTPMPVTPTPGPIPAPTTSPVIPATRPPTSVIVSERSCDDLAWTNTDSYGSALVCGESDKGLGGCSGDLSWGEGEEFCAAAGARMCTLDEMNSDETRGTGCQYDNELLWTSTSCGDGSYYKTCGRNGRCGGVTDVCEAMAAASVKVRCCADVFFPVPAPTLAPSKGSPVLAPTPSPSKGPVPDPTAAPIIPPTLAPTKQPVPAPTSEPAPAPIPAPTKAPIMAPTSAPVPAPIPAPTTAPVLEPTSAPMPMPIPAPTAAPVSVPTNTPNGCGCNHVLTMVLTTDTYPSESWYWLGLRDYEDSCFTDVYGPDYADDWSANTEYIITISDAVCAEKTYDWSFNDDYGDGICCGYGSGSYHLEMDGEVFFESAGSFGYEEAISFVIGGPQDSGPSSSSCSDLGWGNAANHGSLDVCGESDLSLGGCSGDLTWAGAKAFCEDAGARLCTMEELQSDETRGTGCSYDNKLVWTSDLCGDGSYTQAYGSTRRYSDTTCEASTASGLARCCADVF